MWWDTKEYDELIKLYSEREKKELEKLQRATKEAVEEMRDMIGGAGVYRSGTMEKRFSDIMEKSAEQAADISSFYSDLIAQVKMQKEMKKKQVISNLIQTLTTLAGAGIGAYFGNPMLGAQLGSVAGGLITGSATPSGVMQAAAFIPTPEEKEYYQLRKQLIDAMIDYYKATSSSSLSEPRLKQEDLIEAPWFGGDNKK